MTKPTRSHRQRLGDGILFAYANHIVSLVSGLIVTRIVIHNVDVSSYGLWLAAMQVANYGNLLDFGVLAVLPRDVAVLSEINDPTERAVSVGQLLAQATRTVLLQTVLLLGIGGAAVVGMIVFMQEPPLAMAAFAILVISFRPGRILYAALDGLREFALLGRLSLAIPIVSAITTIALVKLDFGLFGVIGGWVFGQAFSTISLYFALRHAEPALAAAIVAAPISGTWTMPWSTGWMLSLQQLAQLLINGSDILLISWLIGPALVPAYVCTTKAGYLLASLPQMVMNIVLPTLASLRTSRSGAELTRIIQALAFAMLSVAGVIALGTAGLNELFVNLWVGPSFYLGDGVTFLVALTVFLRQGSLVIATAAFAWGEEVASARSAVIESIVFIAAAITGLTLWGVGGIPCAAILAMLAVSIPLNGMAIGRRVTGAFQAILGTLSWRVLSLFLGIACLLAGRFLATGHNPVWMVLVTAVSLIMYIVLETSRLYKEQLYTYLPQPIQRVFGTVFSEGARSK